MLSDSCIYLCFSEAVFQDSSEIIGLELVCEFVCAASCENLYMLVCIDGQSRTVTFVTLYCTGFFCVKASNYAEVYVFM